MYTLTLRPRCNSLDSLACRSKHSSNMTLPPRNWASSVNFASPLPSLPSLPNPIPPETTSNLTPPAPKEIPATTFPKFNKLPQELRLAIWDYTILPTTVLIHSDADGRSFDRSNRRKPVILDVNHESRAYGLEQYCLAFGKSAETSRIFFNYALDIAYAKHFQSSNPCDKQMVNPDDMRKLRKLMLTKKILHMYSRGSFARLSEFRALECVYVICDTHTTKPGLLGGLIRHRQEQLTQMNNAIEQIPPAEGEVSKWPRIICCREGLEWADPPLPPCTIHWWFDAFNEKGKSKQQQDWREVFSAWLSISDDYTAEYANFDLSWDDWYADEGDDDDDAPVDYMYEQ